MKTPSALSLFLTVLMLGPVGCGGGSGEEPVGRMGKVTEVHVLCRLLYWPSDIGHGREEDRV